MISARPLVNCEYACCAQFHSRNKFLEAHINAMLSIEGGTENAGVQNAIRSQMQGWKMREWKNREYR